MGSKLKFKLVFFIFFGLATYAFAQKPTLYSLEVASELVRPTDIAATDDGRLFVAQLDGRIRVFENGQLLATDLLNIVHKCPNTGWDGIFGITLHPNFSQNGYVFVHYTEVNTLHSVYSRFTTSLNNPNQLDVNSEQIIIKIPYSERGHRSGHFSFGPYGHLYITTGDGCPGARNSICDPTGLSQQYTNLFGKLLRINVDNGLPYTLPADNPYLATDDNKLDEIFAVGLRNPWAWSFDTASNQIYIGDIGQDQYDELNKLSLSNLAGANFGWPCYEANAPYLPNLCQNSTNFTWPLLAFDGYNLNGNVGFSITGGFVVNKPAMATLAGWYIFGDYQSGKIYTLKQKPDGSYQNIIQNINIPKVLAFAQNESGVWAVNFEGGKLYKIFTKTIKSQKSGDWADPTTWDCTCLPSTGDEVTIDVGHEVTLTTNQTVGFILQKGELLFQNNASILIGD